MPPNSEIEKLERRWRENPKGTVFAPYAEVLRKNGDHALARDVLRQGLELHPDHIPGNIVLGRCCLDLGEDGPAEAAFAHVLDLDAENVIALKALGDITERQGRLAEAASWFSRLIAVDPSNDEARDLYARVSAAQEAAAASLASEVPTREISVPTPASSAVTEVVAARRTPAPPPGPPNRTEAGGGVIADAPPPTPARPAPVQPQFAAELAEELLAEEPAAPPLPAPPIGHVVEAGLAKTVPVIPVFNPEPAPIADLVPTELDLAEAARDLESAELPDLQVDEPFTPPPPLPAAAPEMFALGVEETTAIELSPAGASEFQSPDDSAELLELSAGKSEFQVPDDSAALLAMTGGKSEFQTPDASEDLRAAAPRAGSSEFQTPNDSEELNVAESAEPDPELVEPPSAWASPAASGLAAMAALPTEEMPTEPEAVSQAPSWFFDTEEQPAPEPAAASAPPAPEPEPEPVAAEREAPASAEPEPEPEEEAAPRSTAELKLIFPDEVEKPEPHTVRRITETGIRVEVEAEPEPEPASTEPAPVMTETMAELYARQGHTAEALRVYRLLAERQPNDARLQARIRELETRPGAAPRRMTYVAMETGGESVESFFRSLAEARPGSGGAVGGFPGPAREDDNSGGAPTRPARDPLSLSAIFGEEPSAGAASQPQEAPAPPKAAPGPDAFSFDQFFGGPGAPPPGPASPSRPSGASDEDLDQFQNWLKSLKR